VVKKQIQVKPAKNKEGEDSYQREDMLWVDPRAHKEIGPNQWQGGESQLLYKRKEVTGVKSSGAI